jgi:hypothetical protein
MLPLATAGTPTILTLVAIVLTFALWGLKRYHGAKVYRHKVEKADSRAQTQRECLRWANARDDALRYHDGIGVR